VYDPQGPVSDPFSMTLPRKLCEGKMKTSLHESARSQKPQRTGTNITLEEVT
jgi:hypothetical protein